MIVRDPSIIFVAALGLGLLIQAALILIRKKPVVYDSSKLSLYLIPIYIILIAFTGDITIYLKALLILLFLILMHLFSMKMSKGVTVMGGYGDDVRERVIDFINEKELEYEQIPSAIYLKKSGITLEFSFNKSGMGLITLKGERVGNSVNKIVTELRQRDLKVNTRYSYNILAIVSPLLVLYFTLTVFL